MSTHFDRNEILISGFQNIFPAWRSAAWASFVMFVGESNLGERRRSEDCSPPSWARFHFHLYFGPGSTFTFNSIMGKFHFHCLLNHGKVPLSLSANHEPLSLYIKFLTLKSSSGLGSWLWRGGLRPLHRGQGGRFQRSLSQTPGGILNAAKLCLVPLSFKICHFWKLQYQDVTAGHHSCAQHCWRTGRR